MKLTRMLEALSEPGADLSASSLHGYAHDSLLEATDLAEAGDDDVELYLAAAQTFASLAIAAAIQEQTRATREQTRARRWE